jgi:hypothetical protein
MKGAGYPKNRKQNYRKISHHSPGGFRGLFKIYIHSSPCELHTIKGRFSLKVKRADFARDEENSEGKTAK